MSEPGKTAGMDEAQARKDAGGYSTTVANVTGGELKDLNSGGGPEVGREMDPKANKG